MFLNIFCLDQSIPHYIPRNVTFRNLGISDPNLGTISASLTWLPPINAYNLQRFSFFVQRASKGPTPQFAAQVAKKSVRHSLSKHIFGVFKFL